MGWFQRARLLLVDDQERYLAKAADYLHHEGYAVSTAGTGSEAFALLDSDRFAAVVLNIDLGEEDGLELLPRIKAEHPDLPVIMCTGLGYDEELLQEAHRKGASGYVSKQLRLNQLLMEIHRVVRRMRAPTPNASVEAGN